MNGSDLERIDLLILLRLATGGKKPPTPTLLKRELFPLVSRKMDERVWGEWCDSRIQRLTALGHLDERAGVTTEGREHVLASLDLRALPKSWKEVKDSLLPALALGFPAAKAKDLKPERLQGALIAEAEGLDLGESPSAAAAVDAVCWKAMGFETTEKLTDATLKLKLLERELGTPVTSLAAAVNALCWRALGEPPQKEFKATAVRRQVIGKSLGTNLRSATPAKLASMLAARAAGATKTDTAALRSALQERWLLGDTPTQPNGQPPVPPSPQTAAEPSPTASSDREGATELLMEWAESVQRSAETVAHEGRYDDDRVFIVAAWQAFRDAGASISLEHFKQRLVNANTEGLLRLNRADLVGAMDPKLVADSATTVMNATFHFIVAKEVRP